MMTISEAASASLNFMAEKRGHQLLRQDIRQLCLMQEQLKLLLRFWFPFFLFQCR